MRVIRINAVYGLSSTGRTVRQLDEGLKAYGVDSTTVYFGGVGTERDYKMSSSLGVKLHGLAARLTGRAGYYSRRATKKLLRYLESEKPDIVHLHNLHSNFICLPMLFGYLKEKGIPTAVTLHDCWWYTGKCTHYTTDGCYRWQEACGDCPRLKKDIPSLCFDRTKEMLADKKKWFGSLKKLAVIGVSDWITNEAGKTFLAKADVIERVYNWIDTDTFRPTESDIRERYGLEGKKLLLAAASRWSEAKGLSELAALARILPEDTRLVLIGSMPENAADYAIPPFVTLIPATNSQRELALWYSAADVFISLSREESFGKVTAEALSCGTPVVAVNSTATPELVGEGCGEVVDSTDPDTVLAAVKRVLAYSGSCGSAADRCRSFACESFSMESGVAATAEVYRRLLGEEGRGSDC